MKKNIYKIFREDDHYGFFCHPSVKSNTFASSGKSMKGFLLP